MTDARDWSELERYIIGEHIEDFQDGFITRRELLRRSRYRCVRGR